MARLQMLKSRVPEAPSRVQTVSAGSWRAGKKTAAQRGYSSRWQAARKRFLSEHPYCAHCKDAGRVVIATVVDHRIPHRGDQALFWDESNWTPLCRPHHDQKTREEQRGVWG